MFYPSLNVRQTKESNILFGTPFEVVIEVDLENVEYAIYVTENEEITQRFLYQDSPVFSYLPTNYKNYKVIGFARDQAGEVYYNTSSILDREEDIVKICEVEVELVNQNSIIATIQTVLEFEKQKYAFYLYKDEERVSLIWYRDSNTLTFTDLEPGTYYVKGFARVVKNDGREELVSENSKCLQVLEAGD